jgi:hypothetical protein
MKRNRFLTRLQTIALSLLGISALFFTSCAQDGYDDETFSSDVKNTVLSSPPADSIKFSASTDGSITTITWPVVLGASGYQCSVYDLTDPDHPAVVDSIENKLVDGCTLAVKRSEDTNYRFVIKTIGDKTNGNSDAPESTVAPFSSFKPSFAEIPDGSDIYEWMQKNALPTDSVNEVCIDLVAGGTYTMSNQVDFGSVHVTLRSTSKTKKPTVTMGQNAGFINANGLTLKNVNFECSAMTNPLIEMSTSPMPSSKGSTGTGDYYNVENPIYLNNCKIDNLCDKILYDNKVKYCLHTFLMDNCIVHFTSSASMSSQAYILFYDGMGFINDLTIENSTMYNTGDGTAKYVIRYNNSGRCDRAGYTTNSVNMYNSTFYNLVKASQWSNYDGFKSRATSLFNISSCIFVDCGNKQIIRRYVGGNIGTSKCSFKSNTYWFDGAFAADELTYDTSSTQIEDDPGFADAANGNFTVSGAGQVSNRTGDPRWLP